MRYTAFLTMLLLIVTGFSASVFADIVLAENGTPRYTIVIAADAPAPVHYAAEELQRWLREMTGAELPIADDATPLSPTEIVLGPSKHLDALNLGLDLAALGREGYILRTTDTHLIIAGGAPRGTLYGVYGLLEDHLDCRWFTPEVARIPKHDPLSLPALDETKIPILEYREPFTIDCQDGDWCARNRVNSSAGRLEEKHGGKVRFGAGLFAHSFNSLLPPEKYFAEHPEYFAMVGGKRLGEHTQLCCTNDDVVRLVTENLKAAIASDLDAFVYSVSQNDYDNHCECPKCQALAEAEGSQMAPVLQLVNRVAEAIEKDYPDKAIETLAYQWTRKAPKTMRPRPNVIIRLCSIECCFMHPFTECDSPADKAFVADARDWAKVADRLWVWDYVTSFRAYNCPFPNWRVLDDNIRFFIENNVRGIFEQDNYQSLNGDMSAMGGYMIAKYLWDANYGEDRAMDEFLEGVYGKAAKPIRQYLNLLMDTVKRKNIHTNIWITPTEALYLTASVMKRAERCWNNAEATVKDDPDVARRVHFARLAFEYAWIEKHRDLAFDNVEPSQDAAGKPVFVVKANPEYKARVKDYLDTARAANITRMDEGTLSFNDYAAGFTSLLEDTGTVCAIASATPQTATERGLTCVAYQGQWDVLPDFAALGDGKTTVVKAISLLPRPSDDQFALLLPGYLNVPETGLYQFFLTSNDGSRLLLDNALVIDNDGNHSAVMKSAPAALEAGLHPIRVEYFDAGFTQELNLLWEGPRIKRVRIPGSVFSHSR